MGRTPFQGGSLDITSPRAKAPDFAKPTSRLAFRRHLPQHEGRHSFSDGGLGYSLDRSAVRAGSEIRPYRLPGNDGLSSSVDSQTADL